MGFESTLQTPQGAPADLAGIKPRSDQVKDQYQQIRRGDRLERVSSRSEIDTALANDLKAVLSKNGAEFGEQLTEDDVRAAQRFLNVGVDAIIGPETMRALDRELRPNLSMERSEGQIEYLLSQREHSLALLKTRGSSSIASMSTDTIRAAMRSLKDGDYELGSISSIFESGGRGPGAISTGKGDFGGVSYGTYQLSSGVGTLNKFLVSSGYNDEFAGMQPATARFNAKWKELAANDPQFGRAQHEFVIATHYHPQMKKLEAEGINLSSRGDAVHEMVYSTSTQYGGGTNVISRALAGADVNSLSDAQIVSRVQHSKMQNVKSDFVSSPSLWGSLQNRIRSESRILLAMTDVNSNMSSLA